MRIDLHVHTYPKSQCSKIDPKELINEAERIGLDGFCLTEHQVLWDSAELEELTKDTGIKVFSGNEITTAQGDVLTFGFYEDIQGIITAEALYEKVKKAGGIAIAAHPFRGFKTFGFGQLELSLEKACKKKILKHVDAIEVNNGRVTENENEVALKVARKLGLLETGGSDAHELSALGTWVTVFQNTIENEAQLVEELKAGNYTIETLR